MLPNKEKSKNISATAAIRWHTATSPNQKSRFWSSQRLSGDILQEWKVQPFKIINDTLPN
ncbi:MAG: hypothetical protein CFE31_15420 [Rhizobiales bacterium PAR1]|nr:MAG: hypothetical protein CFE31_15420 [Rhizobiales bacterium PAR1]